jgi:hypothetical protein
MPDSASNSDISKHILPTSATMVGVSITVVSLVRLLEVHAGIETIIDDVAAVAAVTFLLSVFLSFMSLRTPDGAWGERYASLVFLFGLLLLVGCGLMLAWELGQAPVTAERLATWTP